MNEGNFVVVLDELVRGGQPIEIEADTADIFEINPSDIRYLGCHELRDLLSEIDYFTPRLADAKMHRVKMAGVIVLRGSNVNVEVDDALDFLREIRQTILSEMSRKCA
jgi:hypothetical protein